MKRFEALDIFRGLAILLMVLVNTPGNWNHVYPALLHSEWYGITPTDLVFPFFLFIVGFSAKLANQASSRLESPFIDFQTLRRSTILFGIGYALNGLNTVMLDLESIRVMGVLQRIALCYLFGAFIVSVCRETYLVPITIAICLIYGLMLFIVGYSPMENIVGYVDRAVMDEARMWQLNGMPFDPEGIVSTLGALCTFLLGYVSAMAYLNWSPRLMPWYLLIIASILLGLGWLLNEFVPINKNLWTPSFVFVTGAASIVLLCILVLFEKKIVNLRPVKWISVLGKNSLLIYVLSWVITTMMLAAGASGWFWEKVQLGVSNAELTSLIYAISNVLIFSIITILCDKMGIKLKL